MSRNLKATSLMVTFLGLFIISTCSSCGTDKAQVVVDATLPSPQPVPEATPTHPWVQTPWTPSWGASKDGPLPNVLVLGDSISIGYTGATYDLLKDQFDVMHPADNCRNSSYTLAHVDQWLAEIPNAQVITWNNGIWNTVRDSQRTPGDPVTWFGTTPEQYESDIIQIARKLKATGARVIFFTTTDVSPTASTFESGKEEVLNEIAKRVLPSEGIEVYDLNAFAKQSGAEHQATFDVHFTEAGNKVLGAYVAGAILDNGGN